MRRVVSPLAACLSVLVVAVPFLAYGTYGAGLYLLQDTLIFPAPDISREALARQARAAGATELELTAADGTRLYGWHVDQGGERLLLYFHGNGGGVTAAGWLAEQLPGWDVASVSYRGYPGSDGAPSEEGLLQDSRALWGWATQELGVPPERIVVHGQSLGGGVAVELLTEVRPAGLVLDSTFFSLAEVAGRQAPGLPVSWLVRHPFRSGQRAPSVSTPALLIHGTADELIPYDHGVRLAEALPDAELVSVQGWGHGHWLLDDVGAREAWRSFVEARGGPTPLGEVAAGERTDGR